MMIKVGGFVEWAQVYNNYYGTSRRIIEHYLKEGRGVILDLDTQGASSIKKAYPDTLLIFLKTPSEGDLRERLLKRGRDSDDEIKCRVAYARNELAKVAQYDHVIVNDDLDRAMDEARAIVSGFC